VIFGAIAKRLCNGLQIRRAQFDSGSRLQIKKPQRLWPPEVFFRSSRPSVGASHPHGGALWAIEFGVGNVARQAEIISSTQVANFVTHS